MNIAHPYCLSASQASSLAPLIQRPVSMLPSAQSTDFVKKFSETFLVHTFWNYAELGVLDVERPGTR